MTRPAVARIHTRHLRENLARVQSLAPRARSLACVKANGYGHGLLTVAQALQGHSDGFAVACSEEALALRDAGIDSPIVLLEGVLDPDEWQIAAERNLSVCISELAQLEWLARSPARGPLHCWIKIDTGMHRLGLDPGHLARALRQLVQDPRVVAPVTLMTHFASADDRTSSDTDAQLALFQRCTDGLGLPRSAANSAAILSRPDSHYDWVRPGYMLYGGCPFDDRRARDLGLAAAMSFHSAVIGVREIPPGDAVGYGATWIARRTSRIATIAAGYGDGYPRHAPNGTPVLIDGQRLPLAGRVSMDTITVDVTDHPDIQVGTAVELWGQRLPVDEIAASAGTIGYELLAGMPERVPRHVVD